MKNILLVSVALLSILFSCKQETQEEKTQEIINAYLQSTLNDPKSYESVEFGTLDSAMSEITDEPTYKLTDQVTAILDQMDKENYQSNLVYSNSLEKRMQHNKKAGELKIQADSIFKIVKEFTENYKPYFVGYSMKHQYRAKNAMGGTILIDQTFFLDKDLTKVEKVK